jgi:hypothetical protein
VATKTRRMIERLDMKLWCLRQEIVNTQWVRWCLRHLNPVAVWRRRKYNRKLEAEREANGGYDEIC